MKVCVLGLDCAAPEVGYYARVFFNVQGREPRRDDKGQPVNSLVFKPNELYRQVRNVVPDLIVHFRGLFWRSIGTVGHPALHVLTGEYKGAFPTSHPLCSIWRL